MSIAYLNNRFLPLEEARISPLDRGFLFADSIYEVMPVYNGEIFLYAEHMARLDRSLKAIQLNLDQDFAQLASNIKTLIEKNIDHFQHDQLSLYLQITRGSYPARDHAYLPKGKDIKIKPTIFMYCTPLPKTQVDLGDQAEGIQAITVKDTRWTQCNIKSTNLLANVLAKQAALEAGADEAILVRDGNLMEGSASNLFVIVNDEIVTPPKSEFILGGITRDMIIRLAQTNKMAIKECNVPENSLNEISEAWVSSSTKEIQPLISIDNKPIGNGKIGTRWKKLASLIQQLKLKHVN